MTSLKRSSAVPLSLVPALAALAACDSGPQVVSGVDPCLPQVYNEVACQYSVAHSGYWYQGMWYHHVYSMPYLYYHNGYNGYLGSGGVVHVLSPGVYAPAYHGSGVTTGIGTSGRTTVVRGGFGGIGGAHGFSGS